MLTKRLAAAQAYEAPNHFDIRALRLQGLEPGGPTKFTVGLSYILPSGRAGPDSSVLEKVYVILSGELTVLTGGEETVLGPNDSCCIASNEVREIVNRTNAMVTMLVVMPVAGA